MHQWNDDVITAPHLNTQATAMSIDVSGNLALLGSRRYLNLIDLNRPKEVSKRISLTSKWDISRVTWNPSIVNQQYFLTTYNQKADLWLYNQTTAIQIAVFVGHTRAIGDVDWSGVDPNLFATCSLDQYIYLWDIRETKRPKLVTSTVSGASRISWNKFDEYTLASSHDGNIRLWDIRNSKAPTQYITAHVSSINYLDWSPSLKDELLAASQDTTVSFWNTAEKPRMAKHQINVQHPVWKAEYTPFGSAIASVAFLSYRKTPFSLWNINDTSQPVHIFHGHTDVVLDFQWRKNNERNWQLVTWSKDQFLRLWAIDYSMFVACGGDMADQYESSPDFQQDTIIEEVGSGKLLQNSKSLIHQQFQLPVSSISSADTQSSENVLQESLSPEVSRELSVPDQASLSTSPTPLVRVPSTTLLPDTLGQEFRLLNVCLPNLTMTQMDKVRRYCQVSLRSASQYFVLKISFPTNYPNNESPTFSFVDWSESIGKKQQEILLVTLRETAQQHVRNNRGCLEPCLRQLTTQFREMSYKSEETDRVDPPAIGGPSSFSFPYNQSVYTPDLHNIPFPRTSGARFCSAGHLVIFMRPTHVKGFYSISDKIPRSLASLLNHRRSVPVLPHIAFDKTFPLPSPTGYSDASSAPKFSVSSFYYKEKRPMRRARYLSNLVAKEQDSTASSITTASSKQMRFHLSAGKVVVIDLTRIMPVSKGLASQYIVPNEENFASACLHNKERALSEDMSDLVQLWSSVAYLPNPSSKPKKTFNEFSSPFQKSALGKKFLSSLFDHYSKLKDVQTLAMLACTFSRPAESKENVDLSRRSSQSCNTVKRSMSHQSLDAASDLAYGLHKSSSDPKFPEQSGSWWLSIPNMISRSPTTESSLSKHYKTPSDPPSDDYKFTGSDCTDAEETSREMLLDTASNMLDSANTAQYDAFKMCYSSLLEKWKLNTKMVEVQNHINTTSSSTDIDNRLVSGGYRHVMNGTPTSYVSNSEHVFKSTCHYCGKKEKCSCAPISLVAEFMRCVICQLPVKSLFNFCSKCFHGGHFHHMQAWFAKRKRCPSPTNCPCECTFPSSPVN